MNIRRAMPVVVTNDPDRARELYVDYLGFEVAMQQDGMLMLASPSVRTTQLIVAWSSPTALDPELLGVNVSMEVEDVDTAHAEALTRRLDIVYPLTDEPWGIRRFFVRSPEGTTTNIAGHIG